MFIFSYLTTLPKWRLASPESKEAPGSVAAEGYSHCCSVENVHVICMTKYIERMMASVSTDLENPSSYMEIHLR
jgi:hypothetical protein